MKNKLIGIQRTINIYNKDNDLLQKITIDLPLERLQQIIPPKKKDPLLYDGYVLNAEQLIKIEALIKRKIVTESIDDFYVLECYGIYDW